MDINLDDVKTKELIFRMINDKVYKTITPGTAEAKKIEKLIFFILTIFDSIYAFDAPELAVISQKTGNTISGELHSEYIGSLVNIKRRTKPGEVAVKLNNYYGKVKQR